MKTHKTTLKNTLPPDFNPANAGTPLLFDIETTGLTPDLSAIFMIGCGYIAGFRIPQSSAENWKSFGLFPTGLKARKHRIAASVLLPIMAIILICPFCRAAVTSAVYSTLCPPQASQKTPRTSTVSSETINPCGQSRI